MKTPLVLFDIDKTLLGVDYKPTSEKFGQSVAALQAAGWSVGLSSDTGSVRMAQLARSWGMNGPIVSELGNAIYTVENGLVALLPDWVRVESGEQLFGQMLGRFVNLARIRFPSCYFLTSEPYAGLELIKNYPLDQPMIVVNGSRRHSFGLWLRMPNDQKAEASRLLNQLARCAEECFRDSIMVGMFDVKAPFVDLNHEYGLIIIHTGEVAKRHAQIYLEQHYAPIVMVGDSMSDYLAKPDQPSPAIQLAVGNANPTYKTHCQFVAEQPLTLGAIECAQWIIENTPHLCG